jgi:hypothetical protein
MKKVLTKLKTDGILNAEATNTRNNINPDIFKKPEFWNAVKTALGIDATLNATARLPRLIEQNYRGQGADFHDTSTWEWPEEYYQSGQRLLCGNSLSGIGGASCVSWSDRASGNVGFRPLIVFPSEKE